MLLKISLGLAIIVGLATLYISHFQVAPKIQTLTAERNQFEQEKQAAQEAEANAKEADTAKTNLEKGLRDLADATNTLQKVFAEPPNRKTGQLPHGGTYQDDGRAQRSPTRTGCLESDGRAY